MADLDAKPSESESTKVVADRIAEARARQAQRLRGTPWRTNGEVPGPFLRREMSLPAHVVAAAYEQLRKGNVTIRGVDRILRVAWTIADLADRGQPNGDDVKAAIELRIGQQG